MVAVKAVENIHALPLIRASTHSIVGEGQFFRVISGTAWVTFRGEDYIVQRGEMLGLPEVEKVVISPLADTSLVYELV